MVPNTRAAELITRGADREIAAAGNGGLEQLVTEPGDVPPSQIAENVRDASERLPALAELDRTLYKVGPEIPLTIEGVRVNAADLRMTATDIDVTATAACSVITGGTIAPRNSLKQTLEELTDASRPIRRLDQHPKPVRREQ